LGTKLRGTLTRTNEVTGGTQEDKTDKLFVREISQGPERRTRRTFSREEECEKDEKHTRHKKARKNLCLLHSSSMIVQLRQEKRGRERKINKTKKTDRRGEGI